MYDSKSPRSVEDNISDNTRLVRITSHTETTRDAIEEKLPVDKSAQPAAPVWLTTHIFLIWHLFRWCWTVTAARYNNRLDDGRTCLFHLPSFKYLCFSHRSVNHASASLSVLFIVVPHKSLVHPYKYHVILFVISVWTAVIMRLLALNDPWPAYVPYYKQVLIFPHV